MYTGVLGRCAASATISGYTAAISPLSQAFINRVDGTNTFGITGGTDTFAFAYALNTSYLVRLECEGTSLRMYIDGVLRCYGTDTNHATGSVGVWCRGDMNGTGVGAYYDNWQAYDLSTGKARMLRPIRNHSSTRRRVR
jgi:hypothetical protein